MAVEQTSLMAYAEVQENLGERHKQVLRAMPPGVELSNMEIAEGLNWSINRITPRVLELRKKGLIVAGSTRLCHVTGRSVRTWVRA